MFKEGCSIEVFADELRRRSAENQRNAQTDSTALSERGLIDVNNATAESLAKEWNLWIDFSEILTLGTPAPSGVENDVYLNEQGNYVYKVNNLMTSKSVSNFLQRIMLHNSIFPPTSYELYGFTGFGNGNVYPIMKQNYIFNTEYATPIEIDTYMSALGFEKVNDATFTNGDVIVSDLHPRNVLKDADGDLFVVDAEFQKVK
jgi:hypothetical protein